MDAERELFESVKNRKWDRDITSPDRKVNWEADIIRPGLHTDKKIDNSPNPMDWESQLKNMKKEDFMMHKADATQAVTTHGSFGSEKLKSTPILVLLGIGIFILGFFYVPVVGGVSVPIVPLGLFLIVSGLLWYIIPAASKEKLKDKIRSLRTKQ